MKAYPAAWGRYGFIGGARTGEKDGIGEARRIAANLPNPKQIRGSPSLTWIKGDSPSTSLSTARPRWLSVTWRMIEQSYFFR